MTIGSEMKGEDGKVLSQQQSRQKKADVSAHHEDVAVGKVDQQEHPVDQGITQGDQGVKTSPLQGIQEILEKALQKTRLLAPLRLRCQTQRRELLPACDDLNPAHSHILKLRIRDSELTLSQSCRPYGQADLKNSNSPFWLILTTTAHFTGSPRALKVIFPVIPSKSLIFASESLMASRSLSRFPLRPPVF